MKELTKAEELMLLTVMRLEECAYGVAIKQKIKESTGKNYAYGSLYFLLDQLTVKGFVERSDGEPTAQRGGRRKVYYHLTPKGINALKHSMEMHKKVWAGVEEKQLNRIEK